jgi:hypothetical protein
MHKLAVGLVINVWFILAVFVDMPFHTENAGTCLKIRLAIKTALQ